MNFYKFYVNFNFKLISGLSGYTVVHNTPIHTSPQKEKRKKTKLPNITNYRLQINNSIGKFFFHGVLPIIILNGGVCFYVYYAIIYLI